MLADYIQNRKKSHSQTLPRFLRALAQQPTDSEVEPSKAVCCLADENLDYSESQALYRFYRRNVKSIGLATNKKRIAILGGCTTDQLMELTDLFSFARNVPCEFYNADFGTFRQEILDPDSSLYQFQPDILFIATNWRDLIYKPKVTAEPVEVDNSVRKEVAEWTHLWEIAYSRMKCQIIQNNFDSPAWRSLGNHDSQHNAGFSRYIRRINEQFSVHAPVYVTIHDIDHLSALVGRCDWGNERYYHVAKMPCSPECLVDYAKSVAATISACTGKSKKCLVLDLDNTIWGGVIGDDGLSGIRLGQGTPEGEAFCNFQRYALGLRDRGIILAVCSKNEDATAREVFEKHDGMVLKSEDISCFVANWNDKASNIKFIADTLNIGLDSMVFVDDNPAERAIVREFLPDVSVPDLPEDPDGYIQAIAEKRYFETVSLGGDDFQRTSFYLANQQRQEIASSSANISEFLQSLDMEAKIGPINAVSLQRCVQLINKSNQFNLTTRRYTEADVMAMLDDPKTITRSVSLSDRFGDNGLISVLIAKIDDDVMSIDTWLMSCRVLKRGVEILLMNHLERLARTLGLKSICGEFIATKKNGLVREHYATLGFQQDGVQDESHNYWTISLLEEAATREHYIKEICIND